MKVRSDHRPRNHHQRCNPLSHHPLPDLTVCLLGITTHQEKDITPDTAMGDQHQLRLALSLAATYPGLIVPMSRQHGDIQNLTTRTNRPRLEFSPTSRDGLRMGVTAVLTTLEHFGSPGTPADVVPVTLMANGHILILVHHGHTLDL